MLHLNGLASFASLLDRYEDDYLKFHGRELRVTTNRMDHFRREWGERDIITPVSVERFFLALRDRTPATRNRYRTLLKHLIKWGHQRGYILGELAAPLLASERETGERTRRLLPDEEGKLLAAMDADLVALFYAAIDTGLRRGALLKLRWRDVQNGVLSVPANIQKHRQSQRIPLSARLSSYIAKGQDSSRPEDYLFTVDNFRKRWDRARASAGLLDFRWHDIRGEFASRLEEKGVDVSVISRLLGHASLNQTQRYLRPRVERFKDAIERLGV